MPGYTRKRVQSLARNKLEKVLRDPLRRQQEQQFHAEHEHDSDEALIALHKEQKRRRGEQMKPVNTVGYRYIVERFGAWSTAMHVVNTQLREEAQMQEDWAAKEEEED